MENRFHRLRSLIYLPAASLPVLLLVGCLFNMGNGQNPLVIKPYSGAPVTATVNGKTLTLTNNSPMTVYQRIFPTEILAVIEWAPCLAPEVCPDESRIDPGDELGIKVNTIVRGTTESITVYRWHYLEKRPGAAIPPMEMNEFTISLP